MKLKLHIEREQVPRTARTPPVSSMLWVGINGFGYVKEDKPVSTGGFSTCVGLFLRNSETGLRSLFHLTTSVDHFRALVEAFSHLVNRGFITKPDFDDVRLVTTFLYGRDSAREMYLTLRMFGLHPRVMRYALPGGTGYVFDRDGNLTLANKPETISSEEAKTVWAGTRINQLGHPVLNCENTGKPLSEQIFFEIYPGVPSLKIRMGSNRDIYAINFPIPRGGAVPEQLLGSDEFGHTHASVLNSSHGPYVHVSTTYPQSLTAVRKAQARAFSIAAAIYGSDTHSQLQTS